MVRTVNAFAADDGKVFSTHREAAQHDAEVKLKAMNQFRSETILAIITHAADIRNALDSLLDEPEDIDVAQS